MTLEHPVVLVIEDDPPVRELLDDLLQEEGCAVVAAPDALTALRVIESQPIDLITLDLALPGQTGGDLLKLLRQRRMLLPPVVLITGHGPVRRALRQMVQGVVLKPFGVDELARLIGRLLRQRGQRPLVAAADLPQSATVARRVPRLYPRP